MKSKVPMIKSAVAAIALAAGISGIARADDSSMNPFTGESYAYFNGGNLPQGGKPVFDKTPSAWRQSHPNGVSERVLQAESSARLGNTFQQPTFDNSPSAWRQAHQRTCVDQ